MRVENSRVVTQRLGDLRSQPRRAVAALVALNPFHKPAVVDGDDVDDAVGGPTVMERSEDFIK